MKNSLMAGKHIERLKRLPRGILQSLYANYIYKSAYSRKWASRSSLVRRLVFLSLDFNFRSIKLHITNKCNLMCKTCYNQAGGEEIEPGYIFSLLDQLRRGIRNRNLRLDILGGEPLLREDFLEIVSYAKGKAKIRAIQVFTNATLINDAVAVKMQEAGVNIAVVPLHSHIAELHDDITQCRGSWLKTVEGVSSLVRSGISTYAFIIFMAGNSDKIKELDGFVRSLGAKLIFFPYIKQRIHDDLHLADRKRYQQLINYAWENSDKHKNQMLGILEYRGKACPAFVSSISVKADGTVTPCPFVDLDLGNIKERKLYAILHASCNNKELLNFLSIPQECSGCSCVKLCGGGCKASQYGLDRDTEHKDINCSGPYRECIPLERLGEYIPYLF